MKIFPRLNSSCLNHPDNSNNSTLFLKGLNPNQPQSISTSKINFQRNKHVNLRPSLIWIWHATHQTQVSTVKKPLRSQVLNPSVQSQPVYGPRPLKISLALRIIQWLVVADELHRLFNSWPQLPISNNSQRINQLDFILVKNDKTFKLFFKTF